LINYLLEHARDNAFWFPAPSQGGLYARPDDLINGITNFAERQSTLIHGSMSLQPDTEDTLKGMHKHFDVGGEIMKKTEI